MTQLDLKNYNPWEHDLDWMSFTQVKPRHTQTEKVEAIWAIKNLLEGKFKFSGAIDLESGKELTLTSNCGHVRISCNSIQAQLQFRGTYFLFYPIDSLEVIQEVFKDLYFKAHQNSDVQERINKALKKKSKKRRITRLREIFEDKDCENSWVVTRVDIRKDLKMSVMEAFPIYQDNEGLINGDEGLHWTFNPKMIVFIDRKKEVTGFVYKLRDAKFDIYNKTKENALNKNKEKEGKFNELYELETGEDVTRVELRLEKKDRCSLVTKYLREYALGGEKREKRDIIKELLERFSFKNKILVKNKNDSNKSRWKIEPRYLNFIKVDEYERGRTEKIDLRVKNREGVKKRAISVIVGQLIQDFEESGRDIDFKPEDWSNLKRLVAKQFKESKKEYHQKREAERLTRAYLDEERERKAEVMRKD